MGGLIHNAAERLIIAIEELINNDLPRPDAMALMIYLAEESGAEKDAATAELFDHIRIYLRNKHYPSWQSATSSGRWQQS